MYKFNLDLSTSVTKNSNPSTIRKLIRFLQVRSSREIFSRTAALTIVAGLIASSAAGQDVLTWHNNNARTGVQPNETVLTPANVRSSTFGKVFSFPIAGDALAQPLYLTQYPMLDGQLHNVLIVATEQDLVYAFDADGKNPASGYLWRRSMLPAGETWVTYQDVNVVDIKPAVGITGTPVIDRAGGSIYLVAKSKTTSGTITFHQRLHALNIADGNEKLNGPTNIAASVPGSGDGGSTIAFNPMLNNQRGALLLAPTPSGISGSSIFITWASHGDLGKYHGWVMAYNASNIAQQTGAWCVTPNGARGGVWMSGGGPASDNAGSILLAVGNGTFDANSGGKDWGDTALRFTLNGSALTVADSFTPDDQQSLSSADNDMGTSAMVLLPAQGGSVPHLAVTADKSGMIYLLNRDNLGGYLTARDSSLQNFGDGGYSIHSTFAFFNNSLYLAPDGGPLEAWAFNPTSELFSTSPYSVSDVRYGCNGCEPAGSTPSISANGAGNGIVWALDNTDYYNLPAILHAYPVGNLENELYNSNQAGSRDKPGLSTKFTTPTIAAGRVYVGGRNLVTVYGLLGVASQGTAAPLFSLAAGNYSSPQTVSLTDSTAGAVIYWTYNGVTPTTSSTRYTGPIYVENTETLQAIAVAPGQSASAVTSVTYTIGKGTSATAAPQFSLAAGSYSSPQTTTLTDSTAGAVIYWTYNGSAPTTGSPKYTGPIYVENTETLQAIAVAPGQSASAVTSVKYTIGGGTTATAAPQFSLAAGNYSSAQTTALTDSTAGAVIYWTYNGTTPTTASAKYTGPIYVGNSETLKAIAVAPGLAASAVTSVTYTLGKGPTATSAPQFSLPAGTYSGPQTVTLSDSNPNAAIYWTYNGSAPTSSSTRYTAGIYVENPETLKAIAIAPGLSASPVVSAAYSINK